MHCNHERRHLDVGNVLIDGETGPDDGTIQYTERFDWCSELFPLGGLTD